MRAQYLSLLTRNHLTHTMAKVSVIIPCYNQGLYVSEAVDSILAQTYQDLEIIIVNDGSTDEQTNTLLDAFSRDKTKVIVTSNQGLAAARNNGISAASGQYILPLDADDRIAPLYIEKAVQLLDSEPDTGIVYCRAMLFGAVESEWVLPAYSLEEMLKDNVIFCSALFRREDWEAVGGYDTGMIYGWEDYDFWLSLIESGRTVRQLDSHLFYYRVSPDSMVRTKEKWQKIEMFTRIYHRHQEFIGKNIEVWIGNLIELREPYHTCRLYIDIGNGLNEKDSIVRKIIKGTQRISFELNTVPKPKTIRLDPIDCSACIKIEHLIIHETEDSTSLATDNLSSNAVHRSGNVFMFSDTDPQITIPVPRNGNTIHTLEMELTVLSVGNQSLREIIDYQKNYYHYPVALHKSVAGWLRKNITGQR